MEKKGNSKRSERIMTIVFFSLLLLVAAFSFIRKNHEEIRLRLITFDRARREILTMEDFSKTPLLYQNRLSLASRDQDLYITLDLFYQARKAYYSGDKVKCHDCLRGVDQRRLTSGERAEYDKLYDATLMAAEEYYYEQRKIREEEAKKREEMWEMERLEKLKESGVPSFGMPEDEVFLTSLGMPTQSIKSTDNPDMFTYYIWDNGYREIFRAVVCLGIVIDVTDSRALPGVGSGSSRSGQTQFGCGGDYDDFDSFYDDYYDDFIDIDEARTHSTAGKAELLRPVCFLCLETIYTEDI